MLIITSTGFIPSAGQGTTLVWGTGGALRSPAPASNQYAGEGYFTVKRLNQADKIDLVYGENCTGVEAWRVILKHGGRWNITVQDDSAMTAPTTGSTVAIVDYINGALHAFFCTIINNEYETAQRQPGERVLQVENLTLADSQIPAV